MIQDNHIIQDNLVRSSSGFLEGQADFSTDYTNHFAIVFDIL